MVCAPHVEVRAYLKIIGFSSGGFGEPKLADVEEECAERWLIVQIVEEIGFVEQLRKAVNGCGEGTLFGFVWVRILVAILVEEPLGCFRDFGPVDGDVGRQGWYKAEKALEGHIFVKEV